MGELLRDRPRAARRGSGTSLLVSHTALVAALVLAARSAGAQSRATARLEVEHTREATACASAPDVRGGVADRLGYDPFADDAPRRAHVRFARRAGVLVARVELDAAASTREGVTRRTRTLRGGAGEDCTELGNAVALVLALALDPQAVSRRSASSEPARTTGNAGATAGGSPAGASAATTATTSPAARSAATTNDAATAAGATSAPSTGTSTTAGAPSPRSVATSTQPAATSAPANPTTTLRVAGPATGAAASASRASAPPPVLRPYLGLDARLTLPGTTPLVTIDNGATALSVDGALFVGVRGRAWSVALEAQGAVPGTATHDAAGAQTAPITWWRAGGAVVGCGYWSILAFCGDVAVGAATASSSSLLAQGATTVPDVALGVRAGAEVPLGRTPLALRALLGADVWLVSPIGRIAVTEGSTPVGQWRRGNFTGFLSLGAVVYFR